MADRIESIEDVANLRQVWERFVPEVTGGKFVRPVTMVNNGYLHALNASFDGLFLREQSTDSLLTPTRPMNFGTIQPCIRIEDGFSSRGSELHLTLFEIWGTSVLGFDQLTPQQMADKTIREFLTFYTNYAGLNPKDLRIFYFGGGSLEGITKGRAKSHDYIEPDDFSVEIWENQGLSENQLIPEFSNETFLLHMANPLREHHSGYRNDIFIDIEGDQFEIATLNFISHQSVVENGDVVGIKPLPFYLREIAIGQERLLSVSNRSSTVYDLPHISPLIAGVEGRQLWTWHQLDALRAIHYVVSDGWTFEQLRGKRYREHRHELNKLREIVGGNPLFNVYSEYWDYLKLNAESQPWHPKLVDGIESTIHAILYR